MNTTNEVHPGQGFHPEMGESAPANVLMVVSHNFRDTWCAEWNAERTDEAMVAFRSLRIRARNVRPHGIGGTRVGCLVTGPACDKLLAAKIACLEMLLD